MTKEVEEYLEGVSKLLNGQLRGAINKKAKEENLELIQLTIMDIYNNLEDYFKKLYESEKSNEALKNFIKDINKDE